MFGIDTALIGLAAGCIVNALGAFRSPAGVAVTRILPHAVRLAWSVSRGRDARAEAEALLKLVPAKIVEAEKPVEETDANSQRQPATKSRGK